MRSKKRISVIRLAAIFLGLALTSSGADAALWLLPDAIDFGVVGRDAAFKRYVTMKNDGASAVEILGPITKCALRFDPGRKKIMPGEVAEGVLTLFSGTLNGGFDETVTVLYRDGSDPQPREAAVRVRWTTMPAAYSRLAVSRTGINLGQIPVGKTVPFSFIVTNTGTADGEISALRVDQGISVRFPVAVKAGKSVTVEGTFWAADAGKSERGMLLEPSETFSPRFEVTLFYHAVIEHKNGATLEMHDIESLGDGTVRIPVTVSAGAHMLHVAAIEEASGVKLPVEERLPVFLSAGESRRLHVRIPAQAAAALSRSYIYIVTGVGKFR